MRRANKWTSARVRCTSQMLVGIALLYKMTAEGSKSATNRHQPTTKRHKMAAKSRKTKIKVYTKSPQRDTTRPQGDAKLPQRDSETQNNLKDTKNDHKETQNSCRYSKWKKKTQNSHQMLNQMLNCVSMFLPSRGGSTMFECRRITWRAGVRRPPPSLHLRLLPVGSFSHSLFSFQSC